MTHGSLTQDTFGQANTLERSPSLVDFYQDGAIDLRPTRTGFPEAHTAWSSSRGVAGSQVGCSILGDAFAEGFHGLPEDAKQATKWYRKMDECEEESVNDAGREEAAAWLREHAVD